VSETLRPCWQNCFLPEDEHALKDEELAAIDAMEDSLATLDDNAVRIRELITCFESCYHQADRQAELIIKSIGSDLHPDESFACCERNILSTPLCERLGIISNTLRAYWKNEETDNRIDGDILALLGTGTPVKYWLAASLGKTISSQLDPDNVKRMYEWVVKWIK